MSKELMAIDFASPIDSLDAYIYRVNQVPLLTAEEEQNLANDYFNNNCLDSARRLILAHLRYVVRIARGYSGYGLALGDLIQEGNIGLMKAVKRFNPQMGVRLVSFAVHWIKAEIHEFVIKNWRIVKIATTKAQRKCFFNLRKMKNRLGWFTPEEVSQVAQDLGVSTETVTAMEQRLNAMDVAFERDNDDDNPYATPAYTLESDSLNPEDSHQQMVEQQTQLDELHQALTTLDERSQAIIAARWTGDKKQTLKELAAKHQVSPERIRQIEANAFAKLKEIMQNAQ